MPQDSLLVGLDLGTSSTTSNHVLVRDFHNPERRERISKISDVRDWPGCTDGVIGNNCVPTTLIYHRITRKLLFWGFHAKSYLDKLEDPYLEPPFGDVIVIETIKLLLIEPNNTRPLSPTSLRRQYMRETLFTALGKRPEEVFEDFLNAVLLHVLSSVKKYSASATKAHHVELIMAFPSGWPDQVHTCVGRIGARAMRRALTSHCFEDMTFKAKNVYTVSETLCGVKEWLRDDTAKRFDSTEFNPPPINLDEINVSWLIALKPTINPFR